MYWLSYEAQVRHFWKKEKLTAKKEYLCDECKKKILVGTTYLYIPYIFAERNNQFCTFEMCLECDKDWSAILRIFRENGYEDASIIYGLLDEAIRDAFDAGFLKKDDPLVVKWLSVSGEEDVSEKRQAFLEMKKYSRPLL